MPYTDQIIAKNEFYPDDSILDPILTSLDVL